MYQLSLFFPLLCGTTSEHATGSSLTCYGKSSAKACLGFGVTSDDALPGLPHLPGYKAMPMQDVQRPLYPGTAAKRNSSNNSKKVCSCMGPSCRSLGHGTNICAGAWERQGGSGRQAGGLLHCRTRYPIQPGMQWGITTCMGWAVVCSGEGCAGGRVTPVTVPGTMCCSSSIKQRHPELCYRIPDW